MTRRNEIEEIRKTISLDEFQIRRDGNIYSQYSGRVAEVMTAVGQVMPAGGRLLTIEAERKDAGLVSISYFPVRDGKRIPARYAACRSRRIQLNANASGAFWARCSRFLLLR